MAGETILIVDDSRETVETLTEVLQSKGYNVLHAKNGRRGLELALEREPNLILLDWNLPKLSGYQVLQSLRERGSQAPVVLTPMHGSEHIAVQAFRLGVRDYIPKPLRVPEVMNAIEQALAEERLRREREQMSRQLKEVIAQMEQQLLELTTLQAIGQSLTATLELEKVLNRVVEAACFFSDAREGMLLMLDEEDDALLTRASYGTDHNHPPDRRLQYSTSPLRQAIETGRPLFLRSGTDDDSIKIKTGYLVRSLLYVPLYVHEHPLGLLGVTDKVGSKAFTPDDARLLTSLGSYAAIAIENARLYGSEKNLARAETVKQMIVTLSHYIKNPLTAISLSTYDLGTKHEQGQLAAENDALKRNLQMIEMNVKEIAAVITILQQLASPQETTYVNGIKMIDIEEQVREKVLKIRNEYPELNGLLEPANRAEKPQQPTERAHPGTVEQ